MSCFEEEKDWVRACNRGKWVELGNAEARARDYKRGGGYVILCV